MIYVAAALMAIALLVLALRGSFGSSRTNVPIGATAAIAIPVIGVMWFASIQPLNRWVSAQPDAESFAPNLLDAAPNPVEGGCPPVSTNVDRLHGFGRGPAGAEGRLQWIEGHVPRWLPDGFGLVTWDNWRVSLGIWADERRCRQVQLVLFEGHPDSPRWSDFAGGDHVGDWAFTERPCPDSVSEGPCLQYLAWSHDEPGEGEREVMGLHLQTWGVDRDEADRIARGIPV